MKGLKGKTVTKAVSDKKQTVPKEVADIKILAH